MDDGQTNKWREQKWREQKWREKINRSPRKMGDGDTRGTRDTHALHEIAPLIRWIFVILALYFCPGLEVTWISLVHWLDFVERFRVLLDNLLVERIYFFIPSFFGLIQSLTYQIYCAWPKLFKNAIKSCKINKISDIRPRMIGRNVLAYQS